VDIKLKIGQRIKKLRENSAMSQKDLAYTADLDRSYIASIENGQRNVSIVNIEKIAVALDVSLKELFNDDKFDNVAKRSKRN
jgi:transcriptional regulator with XRE-family HTH domain